MINAIKSKFTFWIDKYIIAPKRLKELARNNPDGAEVIRRVRQQNLTYLSTSALTDLFIAVQEMETNKLDGVLIEAGCALGGSAVVIASAKTKEQGFLIYDTFGMIPPPSDEDGEDSQIRWKEISLMKSEGLSGDVYYGYVENLLDRVKNAFVRFGFVPEENNITFVQGLFEDTMELNHSIALAHLDCDWYESVMTCLMRIEPNLVPGGTLVIDDYNHWSGCKKAVDEYFSDKKDAYIFRQLSRLHIIKK